MSEEIKTLGDALPAEIARVNELIGQYRSIGPPGTFGVIMMTNSVNAAMKAMMEGDVVAMLRCYKDLQEYEG
jgi:pyruvate/2-oxoglutarate dehydrogenase complex dihydrolipoamide acyltransferase (E2) component